MENNKLTYARLVGDIESIMSVLEGMDEYEDADILSILRDKYLNIYLSMTSKLYDS